MEGSTKIDAKTLEKHNEKTRCSGLAQGYSTTCIPCRTQARLLSKNTCHLFCLRENYDQGIGDHSQYPCPPGSYCLTREEDPLPCPAGRFRNSTGAAGVDDCELCPGGSFCPVGSTDATVGATFDRNGDRPKDVKLIHAGAMHYGRGTPYFTGVLRRNED